MVRLWFVIIMVHTLRRRIYNFICQNHVKHTDNFWTWRNKHKRGRYRLLVAWWQLKNSVVKWLINYCYKMSKNRVNTARSIKSVDWYVIIVNATGKSWWNSTLTLVTLNFEALNRFEIFLDGRLKPIARTLLVHIHESRIWTSRNYSDTFRSSLISDGFAGGRTVGPLDTFFCRNLVSALPVFGFE